MTLTETIVEITTPVEDHELHHTCCRDEDVSVCGLRFSSDAIESEGPATCSVCIDLWEGDYCPKGYTCPEDDDA